MAGESAGTERDDGDALHRGAAGQGAAVLEDEAAGKAVQLSGDAFNGDVAG